jgi:predicted 3-demethylubiquinone-9 3-methyltransferase (glyoxalase superfamily)
MARVNTYLNFSRNTKEAFNYTDLYSAANSTETTCKDKFGVQWMFNCAKK